MKFTCWLLITSAFILLSKVSFALQTNEGVFYLNTSNENKLKEFQEYLPGFQISAKKKDLAEPLADEIIVIQYKASQFEDAVLVDDVSLNVEGADVGVNIKWLLPKLGNYVGRSAEFSCLQGIRAGDQIKIYKGCVKGTIVEPRGDGFGIGPFFLPEGASKTLGEFMDPQYNPRYLALQNFLKGHVYMTQPLMIEWQGKFQNQG